MEEETVVNDRDFQVGDRVIIEDPESGEESEGRIVYYNAMPDHPYPEDCWLIERSTEDGPIHGYYPIQALERILQ